MIRISAIGGYGEIGRNMTMVTVDDESVILDMGMHMERLLSFEQEEHNLKADPQLLKEGGVIPDDSKIDKKKVKAIILSHAHLDHIAAVPYLEQDYNCPIISAAYTAEVLKRQFSDNNLKRKNIIQTIPPNTFYPIGKKMTVELVPITHSIPHTMIIFLHTPYGVVAYANDFKLDLHPIIGKKPPIEKLMQYEGKIKILISECLKAEIPAKTPSEAVARQMLEDVLFNTDTDGKGIFVTTFSSHIARLHSIVQFAKRLNRKCVLLGRSLEKYASCATAAGIHTELEDVEIVAFREKIRKKLKFIQKEGTDKYVIVMTGHQGEQQAVLANMLNGKLQNVFQKSDLFIFSCDTIPTEEVIAAREKLEAELDKQGLRVYKDIHSSGHAYKEDLREILMLLKPKHVFPTHGITRMTDAYIQMATQEGYELNKNMHILTTGQHKDITE